MTDAARAPIIVAAAALVRADGRVLLQRRPPGKPMPDLWEFPGGKLEPGETPAAALARELAEELEIAAAPGAMTPLAFATEGPLLLLLYVIRDWRGEPVARHAAEFRWVAPAEMPALPMPPADVPLVAALACALG